jgi:iron(III) transport system permease protein
VTAHRRGSRRAWRARTILVLRLLVLAVVLSPTLWLLIAGLSAAASAVAHGIPVWDAAARRAYANSLLIATGAATGAAAAGLPYGWWMARVRTRFRRLLAVLSLLPVLLPPYAVALAWLLLLSREGPVAGPLRASGWTPLSPVLGRPGAAALVLAGCYWPVAAWFVWAGARAVPAELEDAARLEAASHRAAWLAARPQIATGIGAAALLIFLLGFADFGVANTLGIAAYPRELVDRFNADYDFAEAARLALPVLLTVIPLAWANVAVLSRLDFAPAGGREARPVRPGQLAIVGGCLCALILALTALVPLWSLALYSAGGVAVARVWQEAAPALATSAWLGLLAAGAAVVLALLMARLPGPLDLLVTLPYAFPGSLVAIAAIAILNRPGPLGEIYGTSAALVWVYVVLFAPFAFRSLAPGWRMVDGELLDDARLAGAGAWLRFRVVAWPAVWPAALMGGAAVTLLAGREMDATALLRTPGLQTLAFQIHDYLHFYPVPNVAALCLSLIGLQVAGLALAAALGAWVRTRHAREEEIPA